MNPTARERLARDLHDYADSIRQKADIVDDIAEQVAEGELSVSDVRELAIKKQMWGMVRMFDGGDGDE